MAIAPTDLKAFRASVMTITGLSGDSVGIIANEAHLANGGYHCGVQDIKDIGKYPPAAKVDYSVSNTRDRIGGNDASACDIGDDWPIGGRDAWIRWNNLMVRQMQTFPDSMFGLRGMNFTPNGTAKQRIDLAHGPVIIPSTDTVTIHTHLEWWRNTSGTRTFGTILALIQEAITGVPMAEFTQPQINDLMYTTVTNPGGALHARLTIMQQGINTLLGGTVDYQAIGVAVADALVADETLPHITDADRQSIAERTAALFGDRLNSEA